MTPLGVTAEALWENLLIGRSALRSWPDLADLPIAVAARVPLDIVGPRGAGLAVHAARDALADAGLDGQGLGLWVGTTLGESEAYEAAAPALPDRSVGGADAFAAAVRAATGATGPARTTATACAAGNYAIGLGAEAVVSGQVRAALSGGCEPLSRIALVGFARLRAMDPARCRPFDRARAGMQLGEGAAFVAIERSEDAEARGVPGYATVRGFGLSCDADHPTRPRADGLGMALAMQRALDEAEVRADAVGLVLAHGSGTPASDAAEAVALHRIFGPRVPPVCALKGALGHALGAATAEQAVVAALALRHRVLPPSVGTEQVDPSFALDLVREARPAPTLRYVLSCGYAFGGLNAALLLEAL